MSSPAHRAALPDSAEEEVLAESELAVRTALQSVGVSWAQAEAALGVLTRGEVRYHVQALCDLTPTHG